MQGLRERGIRDREKQSVAKEKIGGFRHKASRYNGRILKRIKAKTSESALGMMPRSGKRILQTAGREEREEK